MAFCFLRTEEEASSTIVHVWSRDHNDGKQAEHQANVRHFQLSRKRIAARMRTCHLSVYESLCLRSPISPAREQVIVTACTTRGLCFPVLPVIVRDLPARAFAARSRLITADQI